MKRRVLLTSAAALFAAGPLSAQSSDRDMSDREAEATRRNEEAGALLSEGSPNDRAMAGFSKPNISITTEEGETTVSLAYSFELFSDDPDPEPARNGATFYTVSRTKASIVASAPIDGEGLEALPSLFAGDSLIHGVKVKFAVSHLLNKLGDGTGARMYVEPAYKACLSTEIDKWLAVNPNSNLSAATLNDAIEERFKTRKSYQVTLEGLADNGAYPDAFKYLVDKCVPASGRTFKNVGELVDRHTPDGDKYWSKFIDKKALGWFFGGDASVGQDDYSYLDRTAFGTPEVNRTSWEVGAYAGATNWDSTFSARLRAVYGRTWDLPADGEACEPAGDPPEEQCLTGPDGPPEKIDTGLISFETRHLFKLDSKRSIAFAPQVTYRIEDDVVGVEVPVYLSPGKDSKLTGGLKFAWTSKESEFGVGVFVGIPLKMDLN
jgi:hypothetical protein